MLACPVNVSEGRHHEVIGNLAVACGSALVDLHSDVDHHRSVLTLAGSSDAVEEALWRLERRAAELLDVSFHHGVHPRLGAVDVVPFVSLNGGVFGRELAAETARRHAGAVASALGVPVFLYGDADPAGSLLPELRRQAFSARLPDFGPDRPHPTLGAMAVGARLPLVALNCELAGPDVALARRIAATIRESGGGLPGVRALGFTLGSRHVAQVSMNLTDLARTGVEQACMAVRNLARDDSNDVVRVELVGLLPASELARCSAAFLAWSDLAESQTLEARLEGRGPR
ncbi:MAG: glutamate formimidoyltransferase [Acidimicrobiia bacterium]